MITPKPQYNMKRMNVLKTLLLSMTLSASVLMVMPSCSSLTVIAQSDEPQSLRNLYPGMSREDMLKEIRKRKVDIYGTEFIEERDGTALERYIFRFPTRADGRLIGYDWVTVTLRNGRLVEKLQRFEAYYPNPFTQSQTQPSSGNK